MKPDLPFITLLLTLLAGGAVAMIFMQLATELVQLIPGLKSPLARKRSWTVILLMSILVFISVCNFAVRAENGEPSAEIIAAPATR